MTKKYHFTSDPVHGWLQVEIQELIDLGIADKISRHSYIHGLTVYLEKDYDVPLFLNAKQKVDPSFTIKDNVICKHLERTVIRQYASFKKG